MKKKKSLSLNSIIVIAVIVLGAYFFASGTARKDIERSINQSYFQSGQQLPAQAGALATPVLNYSNLTCNSVTLNWNRISGAKGYEVYGPASVCNVKNSAGYCGKSSGGSNTSKTITGLAESTLYSGLNPNMEGFTVLAYKSSTYSAPATRLNIQTPSCGGSSTVPTVNITSHSGTVSVTSPTFSGLGGNSTNAAIVRWSVNGAPSQAASGVSPWSASGIPLNPGMNTITVTAYSGSGIASAPATLLVQFLTVALDQTPPTTTTAAPSSSWANTNISRTLTCTDDVGGSGCANTYWKFVAVGSACGTSGYSTGTVASTTTQGQWRLCYYSVDNQTNTETPVFQEPYKLDSGLPTGSVTSPTSGQTISGTVTLSASATDSLSGVASVAFRVDGAIVSTDTTSPYTASWNSTSVSNGTHTFSVVVIDVAGNSLTSANVSATVSNTATGLSTPTNLTATGLTCNAFTLTWSPVTGASGYEIYGPNGCNGGSSNYCGSSSSASKSITGLNASTTYSGSTGSTAGFTVLAYNSAGVYSSPATWLTVTTPSCGGNTAPTITITSPTSSSTHTSSSNTISLAGTATDDVSVTSVTWANTTTGATGTATGTTSWSTPAITLQNGSNSIVVTARDGSGLTSTDMITVTYGTVSVSPWPASATGTQIGGGLPSLFEPSGAFWNTNDQMLYFASDHGFITKMDQNGGNVTTWPSSGSFGNLEGITGTGANSAHTASMDKVYVIDENTSQIKEIGPTGTITKTWTLPSTVIANLNPGANLGAEGIAWVPNAAIDPTFITPSLSGGFFYIGSQSNGSISIVDVDLNSASGTLQPNTHKATIYPQLATTGTQNISDLAYSPSTNKLFVLYAGLGIVKEVRPNGGAVAEYSLPTPPSSGLAQTQEAIATIPTCNSSATSIVLGYDPAGSRAVYKYSNYPQPCIDSTGPVITNRLANVNTSALTATVTWDTNEYSDSEVKFGLTSPNSTLPKVYDLKTTGHQITISGLAPNSNYQYQVTSKDEAGNSAQQTGTFSTGSVGGTSYTIVAAGDVACGASGCNPQVTANWIESRISQFSAVLALGDLAYDHGSWSDFNGTYKSTWGRALIKAITKPAPGNHEYKVGTGDTNVEPAKGYFQYFNGDANGNNYQNGVAGNYLQGYYAYNIGNWRIYSLNSGDGTCENRTGSSSVIANVGCLSGSAQINWFRADQAANPTLCSIAYWHHPRFNSGSKGHDTQMQDLWKAFEDNGGDIILNGHDHLYERYYPLISNSSSSGYAGTIDTANGIVQFTVGTGGAARYSNSAHPATLAVENDSTHGLLKLTLNPTTYTWEYINVANNSVVDSGTGSCH